MPRPVAPGCRVAGTLSFFGQIARAQAAKAELARIDHYDATQSILFWDEAAGRCNADATPEAGSVTLFDFDDRSMRDASLIERGDHAVF